MNPKTLMTILGIAAMTAHAHGVPPEVSNALVTAERGENIELEDFSLESFPKIPWESVVMPGPQYIISDSPEYIRTEEAVALRERVEPGAVRLYVYNVHGVEEPEGLERRLTTVIKNLGDGPMTMKFLRYAFPEPSGNYHAIGKEGLRQFLEGDVPKHASTRTIPAGATVPVDRKMEETLVGYNDLVHGFYEFVIDQPAEISVLQTSPDVSGPKANKRLTEVLKPSKSSGAGRGVFGISNYLVRATDDYQIDTSNGPVELVVADGDTDPWVEGWDTTIDELARNAGNYGVMYDIELDWVSPDGKGLALVTWNARWESSQWCGGLALAMEVSEGLHEGGIVSLPSNDLVTRQPPEAVVIQVFEPPAEGETGKIKLKYSPPGASCLPNPLVFIPVDLPNNEE